MRKLHVMGVPIFSYKESTGESDLGVIYTEVVWELEQLSAFDGYNIIVSPTGDICYVVSSTSECYLGNLIDNHEFAGKLVEVIGRKSYA